MERITSAFRKLENQITLLASDKELETAARECLVPALASLLEAENNWKLFQLRHRINVELTGVK
jgi:hypothetical protein